VVFAALSGPQPHEEHLGCDATLLVQRLANRRQRRKAELRGLDIVEADDRHLFRDPDPSGEELAHGADRHLVARRHDRVEAYLAVVDEHAHRLLAARALERPANDALGAEGDVARGEHFAVDAVAALRLLVGLRTANERDMPARVHVDEVSDDVAHARIVLDHDARDSVERSRDAHDGQRPIRRAERRHLRRSDDVADRARHDDEAVDRMGVDELVDRVALGRADIAGFEDSAAEAEHAHVCGFGGVYDAGKDGALVGLMNRIDQETDRESTRAQTTHSSRLSSTRSHDVSCFLEDGNKVHRLRDAS
jgi:hypothetical protein